ncbi:hypothetical protein N7541_008006 [Penicillium brevicompactum]|uniref:Uncharacterized protein n=1 Tax=Penicillium brevicompactum TaxID=5074 RepID=A0A9W9R0I9_PENBR|nr:uncharacterized protein N7506_003277 [Penicillium brevicompactum]KAJ5343453.1 hypothetical protein N7506_003277 [Penicillium brevicompactum]KAJ5350279.1 hypothetical protein N7541_008006 [Penicillium brevicompactum]
MASFAFHLYVLLTCLAATGAFARLRTFNFTVHSAVRSPDGFSRTVYLINGQQPGPIIDVDEGDDVEVFVKNDLPVNTTIHWHGILQRGTPDMDGVPGVTQHPILPGGNFTYRFSVKNEYGFYWYHSHFRAYYDDAIRGPLLIRPAPSRRRPFEELPDYKSDSDKMLQAEKDAVSLLLNDWTHELSDTIFARYLQTGAFPGCVDSILANGLGRVECLPKYVLDAGPGLGISSESATAQEPSATTTPTTTSAGMEMSGMMKRMDGSMSGASGSQMAVSTMRPSSSMAGQTGMASSGNMGLSARGCMPPMLFRQGYNISSLPPDTCENTTSPQLLISANASQGWLALNLVNSGGVSALRVSLDRHSMHIYAADGLYVKPQEVKVLEIALGQRYSVMIKLDQQPGNYYLRFATYPNGDMQQVLEGQAIVSYAVEGMEMSPSNVSVDPDFIWMRTNGTAKTGARELDETQLSPFEGNRPPSSKAADLTRQFTINQTGIVTWVVNKDPYAEAEIPLIYGNASNLWDASTTLHMPSNASIDIVMNIANDSMDTMGHPMHLHGHKFWVLGSGSGSFPYQSMAEAPSSIINLDDPPYRDTANLPPSGWLAIRYVTDNPGAWILHCHIQWHIVSGMALVLVEGEDRLQTLVGSYNDSTMTPSTTSGGSLPIGLGKVVPLISTVISFIVSFVV